MSARASFSRGSAAAAGALADAFAVCSGRCFAPPGANSCRSAVFTGWRWPRPRDSNAAEPSCENTGCAPLHAAEPRDKWGPQP